MVLSNKNNNINKEKIKRILFLKKEIKKIILKSIIQNLNSKPIVRANCLRKLSKLKINSSIGRQKNNLCLYTGRFKGALKITDMSRHKMKKQGLIGSLQNLRIKSW